MGKSLTETAKAILMKEEGAYPSVSPDQFGSFDRDAKTLTPAKASLRPGKTEPVFANPGSNPPDSEDYEDLGPALVNNTDVPPSAKAAAKSKKDTSKSGQAAVPAEPSKATMAEEMEDDGDYLEEDIELSEELEAFIDECIEQGLTEEEIAQAIDENFELVEEYKDKEKDKEDDEDEDEKDDEDEDEDEDEDKKEDRKKMMKEHVDALLAGENLSEDFRSKAETIFESAVSVRVNEEVSVLEEAYAASLEEEVANIRAELTEQVNDYLNYVVEQWVSENEVAVEAGLRTELTEEFISGLRNLFAEHYIDIPEDKVDVLENLGSKVEELENRLNEEIENNISLTKMISESRKSEIVSDVCSDLTITQAEKLRSLCENIEFTTADEYAHKVSTLKESYFPVTVKAHSALDSAVDDAKGMITENTGRMEKYVRVLGKSLPK